MTSKEALIYVKMCCSDGLQLPQNQSLEQVKLIGASIETIEKDLDRLEKLEKVIDFLKLNFDISLDSKLRISDGSECVQTFITYLPENTTIDEMFKALKEVLENENTTI